MQRYTTIALKPEVKEKLDILANDIPVSHYIEQKLIDGRDIRSPIEVITELISRMDYYEEAIRAIADRIEELFILHEQDILKIAVVDGLQNSAIDQLVKPGMQAMIEAQSRPLFEKKWQEYIDKRGRK